MNRVSVKSEWLAISGIVCCERIFHVCERCIVINGGIAISRVPSGTRQTGMIEEERLTLTAMDP